MIITRHNYEEFFMLFADKELDADGRAAVESFISQNPDLAKELEMLQQSTLADESIPFTQKELLYKKEKNISLANYEEYFLLFADNELNEKLSAEVEDFVLTHPELQNEFTILQQARLKPEIIAFAGKDVLYRKEKKVRRIVPFALMRMGAAAAIVGIAYLSFLVINNKNSNNKNIVTLSQPATVILEKNNPDTIQRAVTEKPIAVFHQKKTNSNKEKNTAANNRRLQKDDTEKVKEIENQEDRLTVDVKKHESKIQVPEQHKANEGITGRKPEVAEVHPGRKNFNDNKKLEINNPDEKNTLMINQPIATEDKPLVTHAVYLETDNVEEEKSLYIGSAEINKNKLKGLLKKATVFFGKKIRRNDNNDN